MTDRFILFSLPRCGSTTLMHLLNCHPDIRCTHEPFNESSTVIPNFEPVEDRETLDLLLDRLWKEYNGIKHVFVPAGWPFPRRSNLNQHLLLRPGHQVILLYRLSLLQQIVSNEMALQSRIFALSRVDDRTRIEKIQFKRIKKTRVAHALIAWRNVIEKYRRELSRLGIPFLDLTYEELFDAELSVEERRRVLEGVFLFLNRNPAAAGIDQVRIDALLDPASSKVNSADTYRLVPGIESIESLFGSRRNGWLFKSGDPR